MRPLRALVANAGVMTADTRGASADGYEMTFAVNYLAHAQLIADLLGSFTSPARIVLLGSNTYRANWVRRMIGAPGAEWRDPVELARPATGGKSQASTRPLSPTRTPSSRSCTTPTSCSDTPARGSACRCSSPASCQAPVCPAKGPAVRALARALAHLPGMPSPSGSAPVLASVVLDDRWARLRDGAFVLRDKEIKVEPWAHDRDRERRLWEATTDLLERPR